MESNSFPKCPDEVSELGGAAGFTDGRRRALSDSTGIERPTPETAQRGAALGRLLRSLVCLHRALTDTLSQGRTGPGPAQQNEDSGLSRDAKITGKLILTEQDTSANTEMWGPRRSGTENLWAAAPLKWLREADGKERS